MDLPSLISQYGYYAVFLGAAMEGETAVALGGLAAHRGYLNLFDVTVVAFVATFLADQTYFYVGRLYGHAVLARRPKWQPRVRKVLEHAERHNTLIILGFRFVYGFRTVTPFAIGMTRISWLRFLILNAVAALIWSAVVAGAGYVFGNALEIVLGNLRRYEIYAFLALAAIGLLFWAGHQLWRRMKSKD